MKFYFWMTLKSWEKWFFFDFYGQNVTTEQLANPHWEGIVATLKYGENKNKVRTKNRYESIQ